MAKNCSLFQQLLTRKTSVLLAFGLVVIVHASSPNVSTSTAETSIPVTTAKDDAQSETAPRVLTTVTDFTPEHRSLTEEPAPHEVSSQRTAVTMAQENRPQLELIYTSPTAGYIQTPGFDGVTPHPTPINSWVRLDIPENNSVMLSFPSLDVFGFYTQHFSHCSDFVRVYRHGPSLNNNVWWACRTEYPPPTLFDTDVMFIQVRLLGGVSSRSHTGFRLLFSFHNQSALPLRLPDGKWNCSVPYWADFRQHFLCNLNQECVGIEDEADCPYTTDVCGLGRIAVGKGCYIFMRLEEFITWEEASKQCLVHGGVLASLNTPEEWRNVIELLEKQKLDVFLGLQPASPTLPLLYKNVLQWSDGTVAYLSSTWTEKKYIQDADCSVFTMDEPTASDSDAASGLHALTMTHCDESRRQGNILCEMPPSKNADKSTSIERKEIVLPIISPRASGESYTRCPLGHMTHEFLACDAQSACWGRGFRLSDCTALLTPLPPSFTCADGVEHVPYTLVCDHRADCRDASDEDFCVYSPCDVIQHFHCGNEQCVPQSSRCDGMEHCVNGADEKKCSSVPSRNEAVVPPPAIVDFDHNGGFIIQALHTTHDDIICPETHFQCPGDGYCLPVYVRCNGVYDCPGKEDEAACDSYTCPGFYRCRASRVCVHPSHLCDGAIQCPQKDDELLCDARCPDACTCYGMAFFCGQPFEVSLFPNIRFLDAGGSGMNLTSVDDNTMLIHLSLAECNITQLPNLKLYNLHSLDLENNLITVVHLEDLSRCRKLRYLSLAGNPLAEFFFVGNTERSFASLRVLQLSGAYIAEINTGLFDMFPDIHRMNFSGCGADSVSNNGFQSLKQLRVLDLRGNRVVKFSRDIFKGLDRLENVYADNYKLCCPATLPAGFNLPQCRAPTDEISSCDALLRSDVYRVLLAVFAALAVIGNLSSFVYRTFLNKTKSALGFGVFVTHLCVSDFCMGVYLAIIGIADRVYQGTFLWDDLMWKHSPTCKTAGFLSLLSSEVSAFVICLITLDRCIVLRFPFSSVRFGPRSAHVACAIAWSIGVVLAVTPLLPMTSHWEFYSQNGICMPLPVNRKTFPGQSYSFGIMVVLNFVVFLLIATGQAFIYWSIRSNSMSTSDSTKKSKDLTIARRLFTVVLSDFLCWFPIGLLGLLAANDVAIPGEVSVAMAIIVLPLNSALNPFLYTVNMILERRRQATERRIECVVMSKIKAQSSVMTAVRS